MPKVPNTQEEQQNQDTGNNNSETQTVTNPTPPTDNDTQENQQNQDQSNQDDKNNNSATEETEKKEKRTRRKFIPSVNIEALRKLEGATIGSFVELAKAVILINGNSYKNDKTISQDRREELLRLIKHYAIIEPKADRKYYIELVYSDKQREELREAKVNAINGKK